MRSGDKVILNVLTIINKLERQMSKAQIKRVDYLDYVSGDPEKRSKFVKDFGDSFASMGFAIVANHGVSPELKDDLYVAIKEFFALPDHVKKEYEAEVNSGQRGYISKGKESAKGKSTPDLKEFYHIGQELKQEELDKLDYPSNIWVDKTPDLKKYGLEIFQTLETTGRNLLKAIAVYLELP